MSSKNRNWKVTVKLNGCWIQKVASKKGHFEDGEMRYEKLIVSRGAVLRELLGYDVRSALMGAGPLDAAGKVQISIAKQRLQFVACGHVRVPKLRRLVENALGISRNNFDLRLERC